MRRISKYISIMLVFVLMCIFVPKSVHAAVLDEAYKAYTKVNDAIHDNKTNIVDNIPNLNNKDDVGVILYEDIDRRDTNKKEYILDNNEIMVQNFLTPVHYLDTDNKYKEIDNSLELKIDENDEYYENRSNSFNVQFHKDQIKINQQDKYINIKSAILNNSTMNISKEKPDYTSYNYDYYGKNLTSPIEFKVNNGEIEYRSEDTCFKYTLSSNTIKEDIIIYSPRENYDYQFILETNEELVLCDGYIISDSFMMPIPLMIDANGDISYEIKYELEKKEDGEYILNLIPNIEWIKNAQFPIILDPSIEYIDNLGINNWVTVLSDGNRINSGNYTRIGNFLDEIHNTYCGFEIPGYYKKYRLASASISYYISTDSIFSYKIAIVEDMPMNSITYTNLPNVIIGDTISINNPPVSGYLEYMLQVGYIMDKEYVTIGFIPISQNGFCFLSTTMSLILKYTLITGIESEYSVESYELDGCNTVVNNVTGKLTSVIKGGEITVFNKGTLTTNLIYNPNYDEIMTEYGFETYCGNNIKIDYEQYITKIGNTYKYIDGDGSIHILNYKGIKPNNDPNSTITTRIYSNSRESVYLYEVENSVTNNTETYVTRDNNEKLVFENGRLKSIKSINDDSANYIEVRYGSENDTCNMIYSVKYKNYDEISRIEYDYMSDGNGGYILCAISTMIGNSLKSYKSISYDLDGNLTTVKLLNSHKQLDIYYDGYNRIEYIFDRTKNGYKFHYISSTSESIDRVINCTGDYNNHIYDTSNRFYYISDNYLNTEIKYYDDRGSEISSKIVSYNNAGNVFSERNISGNKTYVTNRNNFIENNNVTRVVHNESIEFEDTKNISNQSQVVSSSLTLSTGSLTGLPTNSNYYKYSLNLFVNGINPTFKVTIGSHTKEVRYNRSGSFYISVPCEYLPNTNFTVLNESIYPLTINSISYTTIDYTLQSYNLGLEDITTTSNTIKGEKVEVEFDNLSRIESVDSVCVNDTLNEVSNYTYLTIGGNSTNLTNTITTVKNNQTIFSQVNTYNGRNLTKTVIEKEGIKQIETYEQGWNYERYTGIDGIMVYKEYGYSGGDNRLLEEKVEDKKITYSYNYYGDIIETKVYKKNSNNTSYTLQYTQTNSYTNDGVYIGSTQGSHSYTYEYTTNGQIDNIRKTNSNSTLIQYSYDSNAIYSGDSLLSKTYGNGQTETYTSGFDYDQVTYSNEYYRYYYDTEDRIEKAQTYGIDTLDYDYGDLDNEEEITLLNAGLTYNMYVENDIDTIQERVTTGEIEFKLNNVISKQISKTMGYDTKGRVVSRVIGDITVNYTYDGFDRITNVSRKYNNTTIQSRNYTYGTRVIDGVTYTNGKISQESDVLNTSSTSYTYNSYGNISGISGSGYYNYYSYDILGRITQEGRYGTPYYNKSYTYDSDNNIASKTVGNTTTYYYYYNNVLYYYQENGTPYYFSYDGMGNPTIYKNKTMTWRQGRKLYYTNLNNNDSYYYYDSNGIRYKKVVNNNVTEYYLNGTQIMAENRINNGGMIYYLYDETGIMGMIYGGNYYLYDKNIFGDIVGIIDSNGNSVGSYTYDAWGNILSLSGSLANINPFRYRGYYFDVETGFYYLQTRYYDPDLMRFINPDNYELIPELASTLYQLNLYSYCGNNPVMNTDESGEGIFSALLLGLIVGVIVGAVSYTMSEVISYVITGEWTWSWGMFAGSVLGGAISGMIGVTGISMVWLSGINGLTSTMIGMGLENAFGEANHSFLEIVLTTIIVTGISMATAKITNLVKMRGFNAGRGSFMSVAKQTNTKLKKNIISKISLKTFGKIMAVNAGYNSVSSTLCGIGDAVVYFCNNVNRNKRKYIPPTFVPVY